MKVHGYTCPECKFYHDHTDAAQVNGHLQVTCADCGWRGVFELGEVET
jgi:ssDNA-binding Zn-finger/Zn-ribbon topoisomerase 1